MISRNLDIKIWQYRILLCWSTKIPLKCWKEGVFIESSSNGWPDAWILERSACGSALWHGWFATQTQGGEQHSPLGFLNLDVFFLHVFVSAHTVFCMCFCLLFFAEIWRDPAKKAIMSLNFGIKHQSCFHSYGATTYHDVLYPHLHHQLTQQYDPKNRSNKTTKFWEQFPSP